MIKSDIKTNLKKFLLVDKFKVLLNVNHFLFIYKYIIYKFENNKYPYFHWFKIIFIS